MLEQSRSCLPRKCLSYFLLRRQFFRSLTGCWYFCVAATVLAVCARTELEESRTNTMRADSFSERAKLLSWVAVTTHMLRVFTRGQHEW